MFVVESECGTSRSSQNIDLIFVLTAGASPDRSISPHVNRKAEALLGSMSARIWRFCCCCCTLGIPLAVASSIFLFSLFLSQRCEGNLKIDGMITG